MGEGDRPNIRELLTKNSGGGLAERLSQKSGVTVPRDEEQAAAEAGQKTEAQQQNIDSLVAQIAARQAKEDKK